MEMLRCAITQVPLRPEEATRCEVCGKIVSREHIRVHNGVRMCDRCYERIARKNGGREYLELAVARL